MRVDFIADKRDLHFLKTFFVRLQSESIKTERFLAFFKDAAEIAAILLIYAAVFGTLTFCTMKVLELFFSLMKLVAFVRFLVEMQ